MWGVRSVAGLLAAILSWSPALAGGLLEPKLFVATSGTAPQAALTLDACSGATDRRILGMLIDHAITETVFRHPAMA